MVQWLSNTTYSGVIKQYREYLLAAFGPCTVILYGYDNGPSTKDTKLSQVIAVDLNKKVNTSQEKFIKNVKNKPMLISFLRDNLRKYGFNIFDVPANVKTLIAKVAAQEARNGSDVVAHADDVDILCLLIHHCKDVSGEVFFQTFKKTNESQQTWKVKDVNENVDECILDNILFLYAWSGCDITSGIYGIGKIPSAYRCEEIIGSKQTLLSLSRNAIFLSRSVSFFQVEVLLFK